MNVRVSRCSNAWLAAAWRRRFSRRRRMGAPGGRESLSSYNVLLGEDTVQPGRRLGRRFGAAAANLSPPLCSRDNWTFQLVAASANSNSTLAEDSTRTDNLPLSPCLETISPNGSLCGTQHKLPYVEFLIMWSKSRRQPKLANSRQ